MVLYYSGTGNSRYIAKCIASALETDCLNLNERIKAEDTSAIQTEKNVILVTKSNFIFQNSPLLSLNFCLGQ